MTPLKSPFAPPRRVLLAAGAVFAVAIVLAAVIAGKASGLLGGPSPAEQARARAAQMEADRRLEHQAFTEVYRGQETQELRVETGETLFKALTRAGAPPADADAAMDSVADVFDPRRIRPGQPVNVYFRRGRETVTLAGLAFHSQPGATVTVSRSTEGAFAAREVLTPVTYERARIMNRVQGSLYETALDGGATDGIIAQMAEVFAYDVDFQRDVRPGDPFELVFDRYFDENGDTVRTGELSYVSLTTHRRTRAYYRFMAPGDRSAEWYDPEGRSARKFLMKTPVNGARLSSGFGMRRHPIQGYHRMHRGTDFAAPHGSAILAAGDGVVQRASRYGGYGNYIRIRHSGQYETAYAHMSRYARGVRAGARVRQGQVIGYVGSTGASTGPHLHYEVLLRGRQINPMTLRVATGRNLTGLDLELFQAERARIDRLREMRGDEGAGTVTNADTAQNSEARSLR